MEPLQGGFTAFYKDDPEEGTSFIVHPWLEVSAVNGAGVLDLFVGGMTNSYPDFTVVRQSVEEGQLGGERGDKLDYVRITATWTNRRGQRMRGRFWLAVLPLPAPSLVTVVSYQAPDAVFNSIEPVFRSMFDSLKIPVAAGFKPRF